MPQNLSWGRRLYFPSEGSRAMDFIVLKILCSRPGFNPRPLGPMASMRTISPPITTCIMQNVLWFRSFLNNSFEALEEHCSLPVHNRQWTNKEQTTTNTGIVSVYFASTLHCSDSGSTRYDFLHATWCKSMDSKSSEWVWSFGFRQLQCIMKIIATQDSVSSRCHSDRSLYFDHRCK
jgi:hypothetical protein